MTSLAQRKPADLALWTILGGVLVLQYAAFVKAVSQVWFSDQEFSYGLVVPLVVAYLIWMRRNDLHQATKGNMAPRSGHRRCRRLPRYTREPNRNADLPSSVALAVSLMGIVAFLWGRRVVSIVAFPLALLVLMVPLPSYVSGQFSWNLQQLASTFLRECTWHVGCSCSTKRGIC